MKFCCTELRISSHQKYLKNNRYMYMLLFYTPETNTKLLINCTPIEK